MQLSYPILPLAVIKQKGKKHDKGTIQASPKWGKRGVGAVIPLALY